ncbi:CoB--CoM heterodisulfide reductase iron-sulfur subunit B family protein [Desulfovibrio inopinatus]|uniref:CoB--CoM heterodisulfide reductase iron-sulfur subunit B family protein n=1 Tax=Desulfovibrio inopinatus TaxID=102109 RepID=UPI00040C0D03|nr:CoB--CoM heterodisulfide reductase iron-sulfur subunit B family protein [Desulfovibrio inopinatus]
MSSPRTYAYYPGCSGLGTSMEYDISTRAVCKALGMTLTDIPDWSCCGSTPAHTVDHSFSTALSARNLKIAAKAGLSTVTTPCPSCLTNLKTAGKNVKDAEFKKKVEILLDGQLPELPEVMSVLQALYEDIGADVVAEHVKKPLTGLKVACYYGCIMNRPPEVMEFDDPEHPIAMDKLMEAAGATVIPFPLKVECCGASLGVARKDVVAKLTGKLIDTAAGLGVDALVTACPLCQMNLDLRQDQANAALGTRHRIPVFYYTQLLGLAFDLPEEALGLDKLCVDPHHALETAKERAQNTKVREETA